MIESLEPSPNLPRHSRMWHASILVRAHATAQRHTCNAHIPFEGVGAALAIGLDSSGSPGTLSVPCAHSSAQAALVGPLRCSELRALYNPAVAAGRPQLRVLHNQQVVVVVQNSSPAAGGQHRTSA